MSRYTVVLNSKGDRANAASIIAAAPSGSRVEIKAAKRTLDQNSRFWAMLTEIARQLPWHGQKLTPDDWRLIFLDALKGEIRTVPNLDGNGLVSLRRSSDLSKEEMTSVMEIMMAFGTEHGVQFNDAIKH